MNQPPPPSDDRDRVNLLEWVEFYGSLGIATFPIHAGSKMPARGSHSHLDATCSVWNFAELLERFEPWHTIGLGARMGDEIPGFGYLVALDIDEKNGKSGSRTLKLRGFEPPATLTAETRSGGQHLIYRTPYPLRAKNDWLGGGCGLDLKGAGGWIAVAPTPGYGWLSEPSLEGITYNPEWLLTRAVRGSSKGGKSKYKASDVVSQKNIICPVHETSDSSPSLWFVEKKDGTVFIHCYGGCSDSAVAAALGLVNWEGLG